MSNNIRLVDLLGDIEIDDPLFETTRKNIWDLEKFTEMMEHTPNLITLCNIVHYYDTVEPEPDTREHKALLNLFKLLALEFANSDYMNSRIGWFMWFMVCYAKYDSYYPMRWRFHFDPLNWYRVGEPKRPPELEQVLPEDPFNIQGKCWVHPEWYKEDTNESSDKE